MTPDELLEAGLDLVERPAAATEGIWARSAALLIRQALEGGMARILAERAPGAQAANFAAQLVVLPTVLGDADLGHRAGWAWSALSGACHADDMRLPPTAAELRGWGDVVANLLRAGGAGSTDTRRST